MSGIKTYIFPITQSTDLDSGLREMLPMLPDWRRKQALSYRNHIDIFLCAKAFLLLKDGLAKDFGIIEDLQFSYTPDGKPYLAGHPDIHFNISHCKKGVACAIAGSPVGIDIEEIQYDDTLAKAVLPEDEYLRISSAPGKAEAFTVAWTRIESYLKMTGTGMIDDLKSIHTSDAVFKTDIDRLHGYVTTLATSSYNEN